MVARGSAATVRPNPGRRRPTSAPGPRRRASGGRSGRCPPSPLFPKMNSPPSLPSPIAFTSPGSEFVPLLLTRLSASPRHPHVRDLAPRRPRAATDFRPFRGHPRHPEEPDQRPVLELTDAEKPPASASPGLCLASPPSLPTPANLRLERARLVVASSCSRPRSGPPPVPTPTPVHRRAAFLPSQPPSSRRPRSLTEWGAGGVGGCGVPQTALESGAAVDRHSGGASAPATARPHPATPVGSGRCV